MIELLLASSLSVIVAGSLVLLVWVMVRANLAIVSENLVRQEADGVMRRLEQALRAASRDRGGVIVASPGTLTGDTCVARAHWQWQLPDDGSGAPRFAPQQIRFTTAEGDEKDKLILDLGDAGGGETVLSERPAKATNMTPYVTHLRFSRPTDANFANAPVASSVLVELRLRTQGQWQAWRGSSSQSDRVIVRNVSLRAP